MWNVSLKTKALLILLGVFALSGVVEYIIQQQIIYPSFVALEKGEATRNLHRSIQAINREIHHLDSLAHDLAAWDETYDFIVTSNQKYVEANLVESTFVGVAINLLFLVDLNGKVIWGKIIDLETEEETELAEFPLQALSAGHPLISYPLPETSLEEISCKGALMTEKGPMLVSSRPIITSNNRGPIRGFLILGRFLTKNLVDILVEQTQVDFTISAPMETPAGTTENEKKYSFSTDIFHLPEDRLTERFTFQDITGKDAFRITARTPRTITRHGSIAIRYAILSIALAALLFLTIAMFLLQKSILGPIGKLTSHVHEISRTSDLSARVNMERIDEIGELAEEFDGMMDELEYDKKEIDAMNQALKKDIQHQRLMALEQSRRELTEREVMRKELLSHTVIAREKERMRIARELHDETSQALTASSFTLAALQEMLQDKKEASELVERLRKIDDGVATGIQRLIKNLRPLELDNLGLVAALKNLAEEVTRNSEVKVSVKVGGKHKRLDRLIETVLYRVAQEALTNVIRYAKTDEAIVALQYEDGRVGLIIHDEGKGFDTGPLKTSRLGWGIEGMRERVESVGGHFELRSMVGKWTTVEVVVANGDFQ